MKETKRYKSTPSVKKYQRSSRQQNSSTAGNHPWRVRTCSSRKMGFTAEEEAELYARRIDRELQPYLCDECGQYHLGTINVFNYYTGARLYLENRGMMATHEIYQCDNCGGKFHTRRRLVG